MASTPIDTYRRQIQREFQAGNATEHTHRPALKALIETLVPGVTATNEPRRVECGAPDYVISRESPHGPGTLGYVEAKDVDKPLGEIERAELLRKPLFPISASRSLQTCLLRLSLMACSRPVATTTGQRAHSSDSARHRKSQKPIPSLPGSLPKIPSVTPAEYRTHFHPQSRPVCSLSSCCYRANPKREFQ